MSGRHGAPVRGGETVPEGLFRPGKFGRLFPHLDPLRPPPSALIALGRAMREDAAGDPQGDNPEVPAGYTYLGQLIDHDITFDTTPITETVIDPLAVDNFRSPKLDLDCVYGLGPDVQPFLYSRASGRTKFLIGRNRPSRDVSPNLIIPAHDNDLPRSAPGGLLVGEPMPPTGGEGFALIGDPRNDENLVVAQLHLAFLKLHNVVVDRLTAAGVPPDRVFMEARRTVTWHYQWIVLHDFLRRVIDPAVLRTVLDGGRRFFLFGEYAFIPVEFSAAAYRLGHSMVRAEYSYNRVFNPGPIHLGTATLARLFQFTGQSGQEVPVPSNWIIDWRRFFDGLPKVPGFDTHFNRSRRLDPFVTGALHDLPLPDTEPDLRSLPVRNLLRGASLGLPSGQAIARRMRLPALTPADVATGPDGRVAREQGLDQESPLWFYVLKEAQKLEGGLRLGPVGSTILAEVFVGLLQGDPASFLYRDPAWTPTLPGATPGCFTMADLLTLVGELNPLGD
jgi:hypothetical protein